MLPYKDSKAISLMMIDDIQKSIKEEINIARESMGCVGVTGSHFI